MLCAVIASSRSTALRCCIEPTLGTERVSRGAVVMRGAHYTVISAVPHGSALFLMWPMGGWHWSGLLIGSVTPWREEPGLQEICWWDLWPCRGPIAEAVCSWRTVPHRKKGPTSSSLLARTAAQVGKVGGGLSPMKGTLCWIRERVWVLPWGGRSSKDNVMNRPQLPFSATAGSR